MSRLPNNFYIVDGHCDTVQMFTQNTYNFVKHNTCGHIDLPRLLQGGVKLQFFAMFIEPEFKPYLSLARALQLLEHLLMVIKPLSEQVTIIRTLPDLEYSIKTNKFAALIALEGAEPLESGIEILHILYRLGLRSIGLTWNQRNGLADGVGVGSTAGGLTTKGKEIVREMNRLGILVDGAHIATRGFYDLLETASKPVLISHANAAALCPHPRNLTNEQLCALRDRGGVLGISFYPGFISLGEPATFNKLLDHFCFIADLVGVETIGLGSDFDGIDEVLCELADVSKIPNLIEGLRQRGFSNGELSLILGENFLRVLRANLLREEIL